MSMVLALSMVNALLDRPITGPGTEWVLRQVAVGVGRPSGDLPSNPGRQIDLLVFMAEFDLRNNKTEVLAREHIDPTPQGT